LAQLYWIGKSATDNEARAAIDLAKLLPDDWSVVCNKTLWTNYARSYEVDMIVVGDHGVYLLDEKSWRGRVVCGREFWWTGGGHRERSPLNKVEDAARILSGHLKKSVPGLGQALDGAFLTYGFVVFSRDDVELDTDQCPAPDRILRLAQAADALRSFDGFRGQQGTTIVDFKEAIVKWLIGEDAVEPPPRLQRRSFITWLAAVAAVIAAIIIALVATADTSPRAESEPPLVQWNTAYLHVDQRAVVEGPVADVEVSGGATFINFGKKFHRGQPADRTRFYCLIPPEYDRAFREGIEAQYGKGTTPSDVFGRHIVKATGLIRESDRGEPYMEIHSASALARVD